MSDLTATVVWPDPQFEQEQDDRATRYVCSRATDVDDALLLLDALGLNGRQISVRPPKGLVRGFHYDR